MIEDRRKSRLALAAGALTALVVGLCTGRALPPDPDGDLVALVARTDASLSAFWKRGQRTLLFTGTWASPCGAVGDGTGPAYCPVDRTIYLDPTFLRSLRGDLARAYVVAHEWGHAVAPTFGKSLDRNDELLADCLAGAWIGDAWQRGEVPLGDLDDVLVAATAAGDDVRGVPLDRWEHGSGADRARAVSVGLAGADSCSRYRSRTP